MYSNLKMKNIDFPVSQKLLRESKDIYVFIAKQF